MTADSYEDVAVGKNDPIPALEVQPQDLYHAKSFWTRWIFCQDAKVIGYSVYNNCCFNWSGSNGFILDDAFATFFS
jgi:hypothetical protein